MRLRHLLCPLALALCAASASAQSCGVWVYGDTPQVTSTTASVGVYAQATCSDSSYTYVQATATVPSGASGHDDGSGIYFAQAHPEVSTVGEVGTVVFSGDGYTTYLCWEDTDDDYGIYYNTARLYDLTPNITGVSPSSWDAGSPPIAVTISGTNFGSTPTLSITDPAGGVSFSVSSKSNTTIHATVTVSGNAPSENATITVTSTGYNGSGFACGTGCGSTAASPTYSATVNAAPPPPVIHLYAKEVSFTNGNLTIYKDQAGSAPQITSPVWTCSSPSSNCSPSKNDPVAYVRNTTMKVTVKFALSPAPAQDMTGITVEGKVDQLGYFRKTGLTLSAGATEITVSDLTMDTVLPNTTKFYNPMTIGWRHRPDSGSCPSDSCVDDGTTGTKVYVTLATPLQSTLYLTTLHLAVSSDGASDQSTAFQKTWSNFAGANGPANVNAWNGAARPLYYYKQGVAPSSCAINEADLLTNASGSGQCGAWALLLQNSLATNGIPSHIVLVQAVDLLEFMVKKWDFNSQSGPPDPALADYKWRVIFNQTAIDAGERMYPTQTNDIYGDLKSLSTLIGQNTSPPAEKIFGRHYIVKVTLTGVSPQYYDPSYGVTYVNPADFESKAVDGYLFQSASGSSVFWLRKPAGPANISFSE